MPTVRIPDACPPSMSRMHAHRPCSASIPTVRVPDAYPPPVFRIHPHRPCPGCTPTARVPHPYPPSVFRIHPHRPIPRVTPPPSNPPGLHPGLVCGAPSERIHAHHPCPNGAEYDNLGQRPGNHATHRPNPQTGASQPPNRRVSTPTIPRVAPWADMRCPFGANGMRHSFRAPPHTQAHPLPRFALPAAATPATAVDEAVRLSRLANSR